MFSQASRYHDGVIALLFQILLLLPSREFCKNPAAAKEGQKMGTGNQVFSIQERSEERTRWRVISFSFHLWKLFVDDFAARLTNFRECIHIKFQSAIWVATRRACRSVNKNMSCEKPSQYCRGDQRENTECESAWIRHVCGICFENIDFQKRWGSAHWTSRSRDKRRSSLSRAHSYTAANALCDQAPALLNLRRVISFQYLST